MDRHPSTQKRHRQSVALREQNRATRSAIKTAGKRLLEALGKPDANEKLAQYTSLLDKAVKQNLIHKKTASRKKSQLTGRVNKAQTPA
ncbi:MAG: 30S ribosomal protein S20 [candidate division Zixibacteria bacterium]|nr:30S ribosomal protein S20 [candidate division Zixibacteria bacterium]